MFESSTSSKFSTLIFCLLLLIIMDLKWYLMVFTCISLMISDIEHLFIYLLAISIQAQDFLQHILWHRQASNKCFYGEVFNVAFVLLDTKLTGCHYFFSLLTVCSSVFWPSPFDWKSVNTVCPLYVMCHFSLALLLITSFFIVASCRLTVMCFEFFLFEICGGSWMCYLISRNVGSFLLFQVFFPASLSFFSSGTQFAHA